MLNTILFDLDGTLLPLDTEDFLKKYFKHLCAKFKDYFKPEEMTELIWTSTKYMVKNTDSNKTNEEAFFEDFFNRVQYGKEILNPVFEDFYKNDFCKIKEASKQNDYILRSVELLKSKGYGMVVATNPIFPKTAILQRIEWAGLNKDDFLLITCFEEMHFCKPNILFYEEILTKINRKPEECMMVGNDVEEDMIAKKLNIQTYLIEDYAILRSDDESNIDNRGNYKQFYEFVSQLPALK